MKRLQNIFSLLLIPCFLSLGALTACTPEYVKQVSSKFAGDARLRDSIEVERQSKRFLTRQAEICLLSADGGDQSGAELLRTMQAGFSGYFLAVGVAGESIDYLTAVETTPCPGASFLFYVQPIDKPICDSTEKCQAVGSQFVITVVSVGDHSLVDRVKLTINNSFLPSASSERERRQKAFEQLAIALTGVD
jgi:hypothetical protein